MTDAPLLRVLVVVVVLPALVAPVGGVAVTADDAPNATRVGENVSASFVLSDLYTEAPNAWQLRAATALRNATWRVTAYALDDDQLATRSFAGRSFGTSVRAARNVSRVGVTVTGTVPAVGNFSYRPRARFTLAALARAHNGSRTPVGDWSAHHYTPASRSARRTLAATRTAIAENGSPAELEEQFGFAVSAYRNESFGLATAIADDARSTAGEADYPVELLSGMLLGGIAVGLGAAGLGSYRRRREGDGTGFDR